MTYIPSDKQIEALTPYIFDPTPETPEEFYETCMDLVPEQRELWEKQTRELVLSPPFQAIIAAAVKDSRRAEWDRQSAWRAEQQEQQRTQEEQDWAQ